MQQITAKIKRTTKEMLFKPGKALYTIQRGVFQGLKMELDLSHQTQVYLGLYEAEIHRILKNLSRNINTAIDIGAAEGLYTCYFLTKTPAKKVFVFEPESQLLSALLSNTEINGLRNTLRLSVSSKFVGSQNTEDEQTLDSLLPEIMLPCLVKLDVEGAETSILESAKRLLQQPQVSWLIETHSKEAEQDCISILNQFGFSTTIIQKGWYRFFVPEERPISHNRWLVATKNSSN